MMMKKYSIQEFYNCLLGNKFILKYTEVKELDKQLVVCSIIISITKIVF